ncbi:MAG: pyridoxal phosphate-dependent aminotransferase [Phycisphaerae bacterium]|jgi:aspartate/methionine/tyrosine aminotransferase|nr:pyridoxal phosphate-dependent aminotransferase [Phycisphaerae bacterium]MDP7288050.1 pyridoxal phosphate-dependent aminotransferase [Phycisphaerae bacterium]
MRRNIVHVGAASLTYAIREIVEVAHKFRDLGLEITWENIGDPIEKGEKIAPWIREIMHEVVDSDRSWGYCDTAGVLQTREFLAEHVNKRGGAQITSDDIIFFNGLGDAVSKVYGFLRREARILGPTPAYSTHSSAEAAHSGYEHMTYELDPYNAWMPDVEDIRLKVKYNDSIAGILLINPDNPTGAVYPREVLEQIVAIARENDLFIVCDEIYTHIVYNGYETLHLSEVIGETCALVMRGVSKEFPWPGSRCGWLEVLNRDKDKTFDTYVNSLLAAKRLEVCSTTAPQLVIPRVMGDPRYPEHLKTRAAIFNKRAKEAHEILRQVDGVQVNCPCGAFYMTVMFEDGVLNSKQTLEIENQAVKEMIQQLVTDCPEDQRFVYYLMGATGICIVPLSGFYCKRNGFRITMLECNDEKRLWTMNTLADAIKAYLAS